MPPPPPPVQCLPRGPPWPSLLGTGAPRVVVLAPRAPSLPHTPSHRRRRGRRGRGRPPRRHPTRRLPPRPRRCRGQCWWRWRQRRQRRRQWQHWRRRRGHDAQRGSRVPGALGGRHRRRTAAQCLAGYRRRCRPQPGHTAVVATTRGPRQYLRPPPPTATPSRRGGQPTVARVVLCTTPTRRRRRRRCAHSRGGATAAARRCRRHRAPPAAAAATSSPVATPPAATPTPAMGVQYYIRPYIPERNLAEGGACTSAEIIDKIARNSFLCNTLKPPHPWPQGCDARFRRSRGKRGMGEAGGCQTVRRHAGSPLTPSTGGGGRQSGHRRQTPRA